MASWEGLLADCGDELHRKQDLLKTEFSLDKHERYDSDQETGELVFSNDGVPAVVATTEVVGSISTISNTWLWSWANFRLVSNVHTRIVAVRDFGERKGYPRLTVAKWRAELADGWRMSAIAAHVLDARGVYRAPRDGVSGFLLMTDVRPVQ